MATQLGNGAVSFTVLATDSSGPAVESAIAGTKKISSAIDTMEAKMKSHVANIKQHWMGISAAVYAAQEVMSKAWSMAESAAGYNEQMQILDGLAQKYGTTAAAISDSVRSLGEGMISMATTAEVSASALAKGLSPEMLNGLASAAVTLSDVMGTTVDDAFRRLSEAMETNKEKSLKLAVGTIDLKERFGEQAATMTEAQKQAAYYGMIMEKVDEIQKQTGGSTKTLADEMETLRVTAANVSLEMGQIILRAGVGLTGAMQAGAAGVLTLYAAYQKVLSVLLEFDSMTGGSAGRTAEQARAQAAEARTEAALAMGAATELAQKSDNTFVLMMATAEQLTKATAKLQATGATATGQAAAAGKEIINLRKQFQEEYDNATMTTEQKELQSLFTRVESYRQAGYDELQIVQITQEGMRNAMIRANNEQIALLEELYKATEDYRYKEAALELMKEILDAEQQKWAKILKNDRDAYAIRELRDRQYEERLEGLIERRVNAEKAATNEILGYTSRVIVAPSIPTLRLSGITGGPIVGGGTDYGVGGSGGSSYYNTLWNAAQLNLNRMGNAFERGMVTRFARGGIFDRPTFFPMARGMGLMGEAGPEAVMPLKRGRDGKLGVAGGQSINFAPVINVSGISDPEQLARRIVRPLRNELRRIGALGA